MITFKSSFGAGVIALGLGVLALFGGFSSDQQLLLVIGGFLFGAGATFLMYEIVNSEDTK